MHNAIDFSTVLGYEALVAPYDPKEARSTINCVLSTVYSLI